MISRVLYVIFISVFVFALPTICLAQSQTDDVTIEYVQDGGDNAATYGYIELQLDAYVCTGSNDNDNARFIYDNDVERSIAEGVRSVALAAFLSGRKVSVKTQVVGDYCRLVWVRLTE